MRLFLSLIAASLLIQSTQTDVVERLGVKGPIKYGDGEFIIAWTDKKDKYYVQEYLPKGQKTELFEEMLTIHFFDIQIEPKDAVRQKVQELDARKKSDPACNFLVHEKPETNEYLVDFILSDTKSQIVEFNVYRYTQITIEDRKAILVYAYSKRGYGDKCIPFLKSLKDERMAHLKHMTSADLPVITLQPDN